MKTLIRITEEHIKNGKKSNNTQCPIALALRTATGKTWDVGLEIRCDDFRRQTTAAEQIFIRNFDNGKVVKPFTLELDAPEEVLF